MQQFPNESTEHVKASDFESQLDKLQFNKEYFLLEIFSALDQKRGYSLTKEEITNIQDSDFMSLVEFKQYVDANGGDKFLISLFQKGVEGLKRDFHNQQNKLKQNVALLTSGGKKAKNFKESAFAKKLTKTAYDLDVDLQDLTFEQAFDRNLYSEKLQPTLKGAAEYGLSWHEYRNRSSRMAKVKRKTEAEGATKSLKTDLYKTPDVTVTKKGGTEAKVNPQPERIQPKAEKKETTGTIEKDLIHAERELKKLISKSPYKEFNFQITRNPSSTSVLSEDGTREVSIVAMRVPGGYHFKVNTIDSPNINDAVLKAKAVLDTLIREKAAKVETTKKEATEEAENFEKVQREQYLEEVKSFLSQISSDEIKIVPQNEYVLVGGVKIPADYTIVIAKKLYYAKLDTQRKVLRVSFLRASSEGNGFLKGAEIRLEFPMTDEKRQDFIRKLKELPGRAQQIEKFFADFTKTAKAYFDASPQQDSFLIVGNTVSIYSDGKTVKTINLFEENGEFLFRFDNKSYKNIIDAIRAVEAKN